ncbi:hypothetical protein D3C78_983650 [compost metagenome]
MQAVSVRGCTVQVITHNVEIHFVLRRNRRFLRFQVKRHALRHKVFNMEIPHPLLIVARIRTNMPHAGLGTAIQRIIEAIQPVFWLADKRACHLPIGTKDLQLHRLIGKRFTVTVTQQTVENDRFARTIEIAWAKNKELFAETGRTGDIKLSQIERREFQIEQRRLSVFARQDQRGLFIGFELRVSIRITGALRQGLPLIVQQSDLDSRLRSPVFQALGEDIKTIVVAMRRQADIAQSKKRGGIAVVVMPGLIHHGDVNT